MDGTDDSGSLSFSERWLNERMAGYSKSIKQIVADFVCNGGWGIDSVDQGGVTLLRTDEGEFGDYTQVRLWTRAL